MRNSLQALLLFNIENLEKQLPTQLEITETRFRDFMHSITTIPSTNLNLKILDANGADLLYNNVNIAFAAGLIFRILVKVDIELLEHIKLCILTKYESCFPTQQAYDYTYYLFHSTLTQAVYSLDKSDKKLYMNQILRLREVNLIEIGNDKQLGYFYSLLAICQCSSFLSQFSNIVKYQKIDQKQQIINSQSKFVIYQMNENSQQIIQVRPAIVFLPKNETQYLKKIQRNQERFLSHVLQQILIESSLGLDVESQFSKAIAIQPFKGSEIEFLIALLTPSKFNSEKYQNLYKNVPFMAYVRKYFVVANQTYDQVKQGLEFKLAPLRDYRVLKSIYEREPGWYDKKDASGQYVNRRYCRIRQG